MRYFFLIACSFIAVLYSSETTTVISDDFSQTTFAARSMTRGPWTITDGIATCPSNEALAQSFKDHGPALSYKHSFTDGTIHLELRPTGVTAFNLVVNSDAGHLFRIKWYNDKKNQVLAFNEEHKATTLSNDIPVFLSDVWLPVTVKFTGDTATITIADQTPVTVTNPAYGKLKTTSLVSFKDGTFSVRRFTLTTP